MITAVLKVLKEMCGPELGVVGTEKRGCAQVAKDTRLEETRRTWFVVLNEYCIAGKTFGEPEAQILF